jgi:hypothetical protein
MGGFASAIGGMGEAAAQYGQQVRGLLESRRHDFAALLQNEAANEGNPTHRAGLLELSAGLMSGKPLSKLIPSYAKIHQAREADNQAVAGMLPQGPTQETVPGPAGPGQTPGTTVQPVVPPAQSGSGVRLPGMSMEDMQSQLSSLTPAMRSLMSPELTNNAQLRREAQLKEYNTARFEQMYGDQTKFPGLTGMERTMAVASALGMPIPVNYGATRMMSATGKDFDATNATPEEKARWGLKPDATGKWTVFMDYQGSPFPGATPIQGWAGTGTVQTPGGMGQIDRNNPGTVVPIIGAVPPTMNSPRMEPTAGGGVESVIPSLLPPPQGGVQPIPGAVSTPGAIKTTEMKPEGINVSQNSFPGAAPSAPKSLSVPKIKGEGVGVSTHTPDGKLRGNSTFQTQVKGAVAAMLQPNLSTSQRNELMKHLVGPERSPMAEAVRVEMRLRAAEDASSVVSWDLGTAERAQLSTQTLDHVNTINSLIDKLGATGELGPVMSRWSEFWAGTLGSDLTQNQDFVRLKNNIDLMTKLMGRIHGGARGGGSIQMIQSFATKLNTDRMDANTLKAAINTEAEWLRTYADPAHTSLGGSTVKPVSGSRKPLEQILGGK